MNPCDFSKYSGGSASGFKPLPIAKPHEVRVLRTVLCAPCAHCPKAMTDRYTVQSPSPPPPHDRSRPSDSAKALRAQSGPSSSNAARRRLTSRSTAWSSTNPCGASASSFWRASFQSERSERSVSSNTVGSTRTEAEKPLTQKPGNFMLCSLPVCVLRRPYRRGRMQVSIHFQACWCADWPGLSSAARLALHGPPTKPSTSFHRHWPASGSIWRAQSFPRRVSIWYRAAGRASWAVSAPAAKYMFSIKKNWWMRQGLNL